MIGNYGGEEMFRLLPKQIQIVNYFQQHIDMTS